MPSDLPDSGDSVSPLLISALLLASAEHARRLSLSHPSVVEILSATGATRSRAYELRDALVAALPSLQRPAGRPATLAPTPCSGPCDALLAAARAMLRFTFAHPGCVAGDRRRRYSDAFRHRVLELRDAHPELPLEGFAEAVEVPLETLEDWLRAGVSAAPHEEPARAEEDDTKAVERAHLETVLAEWKTWRGGSFSDFCAHLKANCRVPYGATLVSTILSSRGLRAPARRQGRSPDERALRGAFEVFFPNAQWVGDGSQISIEVEGARHVFNLELLVDPYSDAFVGASLGDQEDSEAVALAMTDAKTTTKAEPPLPLSVLLDNKLCNLTPEVDHALEAAERIRSTPGRPQNKAHIEGGFGLFKQTAPPLIVEGTDPRSLARSILALVITTFFRTINHRPRKDRGGRSRVTIHGETPTTEQIEEARKALAERCRRQELARQTLEARQDPEVRAYLDRSFARLALIDPERSLRIAIARYPLDAIVDGVATFEGKRTAGTIDPSTDARYLLGIVRNLSAQNEGQRICEALLRERMAQRDRQLAALAAERARFDLSLTAAEDRLKAFVARACEIDAVLDRRFWLLAIVDTLRAQPHGEHASLTENVARRIHATFRITPRERMDAVRFIVDRVVPLH